MKRRRKTWIENTLKYVEEKESRGIWGEEECFWNKEDYEFDKFIPGDYGLEYNNHPVELRVVYKGEGEYDNGTALLKKDSYWDSNIEILILTACGKFRDENKFLEPFEKYVSKVREIFSQYNIHTTPEFEEEVNIIRISCKSYMEKGSYMFRRYVDSYLALAIANGVDWKSVKNYENLKESLSQYLTKFTLISNSEYKENNWIVTIRGDETDILEYIAKAILRFAMDYRENFNGKVKNSVWVKVVRHYGELDEYEAHTGLHEKYYVMKEDNTFVSILRKMKDLSKKICFYKYYDQIMEEIHKTRLLFKYVDVLGKYLATHRDEIINYAVSLNFDNKKACFMYAITVVDCKELPFEMKWNEDIYNCIREFALKCESSVHIYKETYWLFRIRKDLKSKLKDIRRYLMKYSGNNLWRWNKDYYDKEMTRRFEEEKRQKEESERRKIAQNVRERERSNEQIRWFGYFLLQGLTAEEAWFKVQCMCL